MRFTIRDLLWLTVVIGLATALWLERRATLPVRFTGQPFDVAIVGEGYFQLTEPQTCSTVFTRFGSLSIDNESRLILEFNGIQYAVNPAMCIPPDATSVTVSPTGLVSVKRQRAELVAVGQVLLAKFDKPEKLKQLSPAIYMDTPESGPGCLCQPGQEGVGTVIQGALAKRY